MSAFRTPHRGGSTRPHARARVAALGAGAAALALVLSACSGSTDEGTSGGDADGPVTLSMWAWAPGVAEAVDVWNSENPDIQVELDTQADGDYSKIFAAVKAGQAPDIAQVEYAAIPSFLLEGALVDLSEYGASEHADAFTDWQWQQGAIGESVFAIPQASGPMGMFYRAELFEKWGITPPTTWAEFEDAARKVRKADPDAYITSFSPASGDWFAGLSWQAGAHWFGVDGDTWSVDIDSPETAQVTDYWQHLIDEDLVKVEPESPAWYKDLQEGHIASWVAGSWGDAVIEGNAPDTAGSWKVAPMPSWEAGTATSANHGGSATGVLKGSEHPQQALDFLVWLNSDPEAVKIMFDAGYGWPAAPDALDPAVLSEPSDFFGKQPYYEVFAEADEAIDPSWTWGPNMPATYDALLDGFQKAAAGDGTLTDALEGAQSKTLDDLTARGLQVAD